MVCKQTTPAAGVCWKVSSRRCHAPAAPPAAATAPHPHTAARPPALATDPQAGVSAYRASREEGRIAREAGAEAAAATRAEAAAKKEEGAIAGFQAQVAQKTSVRNCAPAAHCARGCGCSACRLSRAGGLPGAGGAGGAGALLLRASLGWLSVPAYRLACSAAPLQGRRSGGSGALPAAAAQRACHGALPLLCAPLPAGREGRGGGVELVEAQLGELHPPQRARPRSSPTHLTGRGGGGGRDFSGRGPAGRAAAAARGARARGGRRGGRPGAEPGPAGQAGCGAWSHACRAAGLRGCGAAGVLGAGAGAGVALERSQGRPARRVAASSPVCVCVGAASSPASVGTGQSCVWSGCEPRGSRCADRCWRRAGG